MKGRFRGVALIVLALALASTEAFSQVVLKPSSVVVQRGHLEEGKLDSLWRSDDDRLIVREQPDAFARALLVELDVYASSPILRPASMLFVCESSGTAMDLNQDMRLWNFRTHLWDIIDARVMSRLDTTLSIVVRNPTDYVEPTTGQIHGRLRITGHGPVDLEVWRLRVDLVRWRLGR